MPIKFSNADNPVAINNDNPMPKLSFPKSDNPNSFVAMLTDNVVIYKAQNNKNIKKPFVVLLKVNFLFAK